MKLGIPVLFTFNGNSGFVSIYFPSIRNMVSCWSIRILALHLQGQEATTSHLLEVLNNPLCYLLQKDFL